MEHQYQALCAADEGDVDQADHGGGVRLFRAELDAAREVQAVEDADGAKLPQRRFVR